MNVAKNQILTGRVEGGRAVLCCRRGMADDLTIYSRRDGEPEYTALDQDGEEVVDDRPKLDPRRPEVRRYFAMLLYSGAENRLKSNELVLTVP